MTKTMRIGAGAIELPEVQEEAVDLKVRFVSPMRTKMIHDFPMIIFGVKYH